MKNVVQNTEGRLRCVWRILLQFFCFLTLLFIVQVLQDLAQERRSIVLFSLGSVVYLAGIGCISWVLGSRIDRRSVSDYGLHIDREWWLDAAVGFGIGAFSLTLIVLIEQALGWAKFNLAPYSVFEGPLYIITIGMLLKLAAIAFGEEMTFRGYQVRNLAEGLRGSLGSKSALETALVATAGLFGLAHMLNPNATWMSGLNVTLAGLMLGLAFVLSGELALPLGLHFAWGFFEEFVYGFANSGQKPLSWLINSQVTGPDLWTGGMFGPEGGLLVSGVLVIDVFIIIFWIKKRRRWRGMRYELADYSGKSSHPG